MLHQITKCRTRKHWRTVCTSDKFKGQLVKLSFKHTWDFARGFVALAETGTDDFDWILGDEPDPELDPLAYPNQLHFRNTDFFPKIKSEYIVNRLVLCYIVLENWQFCHIY